MQVNSHFNSYLYHTSAQNVDNMTVEEMPVDEMVGTLHNNWPVQGALTEEGRLGTVHLLVSF